MARHELKYEDIKRLLAKRQLDNAYLLTGEEEYLKEEIIGILKSLLIDRSSEDFNFNVVYADDNPDGEEIVLLARTYPFVSGERKNPMGRLIVVRNMEKLSPAGIARVAGYLENPLETTCLVFVALKASSDKHGDIIRLSRHVVFYKLFDSRLPGWIAAKVGESGKRMTDDAIQYLVTEQGNNLFNLDAEIGKLVVYTAGKNEIVLSDVTGLAGYGAGNTVYDLQRAVTEKDAKESLELLSSLLREGERSTRILGMVVSRVRHILLGRAMAERNKSEKEIMAHLRLSPFFNRYFVKETKHFGFDEIKRCFSSLVQADRDIKTGKREEKLALELLLLDICGR